MRNSLTHCSVALLALLATGCDSSDPALVETQSLSISIDVNGATADTYEVWDMIIDNDGDLQPDDGETYLWCENSVQTLNPITVPWTFSAQIELVPANSVIKQQITSPAAFDAGFNVGNYDTLIGLDTTNSKDPINEGTSTYRFSSPRKLPAVNRDVSFATVNPLAEARGNPFGSTCPNPALGSKTRCGLCARLNSGLARIDGVDVGGQVECVGGGADGCRMPWTVTINKGDTIRFQGRIADEGPIGVGLREVLNSNPDRLAATVTVDGRQVTLRGRPNGAALSFSYTSR